MGYRAGIEPSRAAPATIDKLPCGRLRQHSNSRSSRRGPKKAVLTALPPLSQPPRGNRKGKTYRKSTDRVDGQLIKIGVTHDCRLLTSTALGRSKQQQEGSFSTGRVVTASVEERLGRGTNFI